MEKKRGKLHSYNKTPDKGFVFQEVIVVIIVDLPNFDLYNNRELMIKGVLDLRVYAGKRSEHLSSTDFANPLLRGPGNRSGTSN